MGQPEKVLHVSFVGKECFDITEAVQFVKASALYGQFGERNKRTLMALTYLHNFFYDLDLSGLSCLSMFLAILW